ncbi:MFS transporter [Caloranaerobacter azorensis]|uniref:MFS transporter n=1 Tax=Caloranaerobacter azorensis TaxID=116090 RepID=A0A6P1YEW6_9FIRM|nr:MFS transporter [Caloranaerobacter azorensis]QIB27323.1 MFS transporter [Caloranaerobacter azorensis]
MGITRNIKTYYIYSIFADLLILGPILVLFLIAKGLSFTEIMLLQSVAAISVVIFEVPTGAFADKFGRKISILIGAILWSVSLLIYIIGNEFPVFILAEIIFSLGATLKSGADTALIYDSLKSIGREREFQSIEGYARSLSLYAQAVGSIIAGFVYKVNIFLPFYISIGFMLIAAITTLNFIEPSIEGKKGKYGNNYFKQIKESGIYIARHEKIKAIMMFSMIFFIFYRAGFWFFQPYMESVEIPVEYFGIIFFIFNIVAAITSKRCHLIMEKTKSRTLSFMAFLIIVSFVLLGIIRIWIGVLAILLQQMARGLYRPVTTKYLNKHIPSDKRATILSFQSLITNIAVAVTLPFMGVLKDSTDIFNTHLILAGIMLVLVLAVMRYMNKRLGVKQTEKSNV